MQILSITGKVLYESECKDLKSVVVEAISKGTNLTGANLSGANLSGANLLEANL